MSERTEEWTHKVEVIVGFACDKCGIEIRPQMAAGIGYMDRVHGAGLPEGAMRVKLGGWFGGYFDCDVDPSMLLCKACVEELLTAAPYLREAIEESR
jgi:hypothetical protein